MGKKGFEYEIRGYRYAPESFRAFKGLPGQKMEQIPLSGEQRRKMGYLCMTQGGKAGVAYVKHIERERERKCRLYMTYGFLLKENPHRYVYCAELRCRESDPLAVRLDILRAFREHLAQMEGVLNRVWNVSLTEISAPSCAEKLCGCRFEPAGCGLALCGVKGEKMKQLGNLAVVCAQRPDVLMQIYGSEVSVHTGEGPERAVLTAKWDDDETIQSIIRELNFGRYAPDRERMVRHD